MKKLAILLSCIVTAFGCFSCKSDLNLEMYLSELRLNAYVFSCDDYKLTLYEKKCESPYILDGYAGKMQSSLSIRLENLSTLPSSANVSLNYAGKQIEGSFIYNPANSKYSVDVIVDRLLPSSEIAVQLTLEGKETLLTLKRVTEGEINAKKVLAALSKTEGDYIEKALSTTGGIEINLRVIPENGVNYYYVGVIDAKGGVKAYLIDGKTLKILAER